LGGVTCTGVEHFRRREEEGERANDRESVCERERKREKIQKDEERENEGET